MAAIYDTLHDVPRMFGIWACKQVLNIAGTNLNQSKYKNDHDLLCPSCSMYPESCEHLIMCDEEGRVDALMLSIDLVDKWLREAGTDNALWRGLMEYAQGRGAKTMDKITRGWDQRFRKLAQSQDKIEWRLFMEGMIMKEISILQHEHTRISGSVHSINKWSRGLVVNPLETI